MLKALCTVPCDLARARKILARMEAARVAPNGRTLNTLLRGCLWAGDLAFAEELWAKLEAWGVAPDGPACATLAKRDS